MEIYVFYRWSLAFQSFRHSTSTPVSIINHSSIRTEPYTCNFWNKWWFKGSRRILGRLKSIWAKIRRSSSFLRVVFLVKVEELDWFWPKSHLWLAFWNAMRCAYEPNANSTNPAHCKQTILSARRAEVGMNSGIKLQITGAFFYRTLCKVCDA